MSAQSTFAFKARDNRGEVVSGTLTAGSAEEVGARLRSEGKYVLSVEQHSLRSVHELDATQERRNTVAKRVAREDVIALCQQLGVMLETGVPLTQALDSFCQQATKQEFRMVVESLRDDIESGEPFSKAMAKWPRVFPSLMVSLMKASEVSGTMSLMLTRVGEYLAKERRTAKQIKGALSYPLFMMTIAVLMTVLLMAFVLPRFASIYESRAATLPAPTRILLGLSDFITTQYFLYGPALLIVGAGVYFGVRHPVGRRLCDWLRLNTPVLKTMYRQLYITRMARTMGTLLAAGVSLLDIIDLCRGVTNNSYYDDLWDDVCVAIRDGNQLSDAMVGSSLIPPNVVSMIIAGERSSRLSDVMDKIAQFGEEELDTAVRETTAYIEPIMIVMMGVLVGGVALALLLPVFSMGNVVS